MRVGAERWGWNTRAHARGETTIHITWAHRDPAEGRPQRRWVFGAHGPGGQAYLQSRRVHRSSITLHTHQTGLAGARVSLLHLQVTHQRRRLQVEQQALARTPVDGKAETTGTGIRGGTVHTGSVADRMSTYLDLSPWISANSWN